MKNFFDFSAKQIKFLIILGISAVLIGSVQFIKLFATPTENTPHFDVHIGEVEKKLVGTFILDPNLAPADSLELLPGIGKVLADRIVEYRQHKKFEKEIDITDVNGIGPKLYEQIKPYLQVK